MILKFSFKVGLIVLLAASAFAQQGEYMRPLRIDTQPVIDGKLDEPFWLNAPTVSGFKTFTPDYGIEMEQKTVVYQAYDRENLYFGFRCYDNEPNKIKSSVTRRDNVRPDDWVCINLDSFNDQQALYAFYINPAGIQGDTRYANGTEDPGIDIVWYSAGQIDDEGYTIEVQIPFKSIRFANKDIVEMGVIYERRVSRKSEQGTYPALDPKQAGAFLTQMMPLAYEDVKHYKLFELLPAVTYGRTHAREQDALKLKSDKGDFSLTTKYGLTSDLILDGTYNPDFSQIESDAGQVDVNLRFALFFPERRPFFLEGNENFNFSGNATGGPLAAIVHTRTIVDPLAGAKLSGKLSNKDFIAVIDAVDDLRDFEDNTDVSGRYAHATIARYKRALNKDSYIGAFYTGREQKNGFNRVFGPDGQMRLTPSSVLGYHLFLSQDRASKGSDTQAGHALGLDYQYSTRNISVSLGAQDLSEDFFTRTGFVTRTGITRARALISPRIYPKSTFFRRIDPRIFTTQIHDKPSGKYETENTFSLQFIFKGNSNATLNATYANEIFYARDVSGVLLTEQFEKFKTSNLRATASHQFNRSVAAAVSFTNGKFPIYTESRQGHGSVFAGSLTLQPSEKINLNVNLTYQDLFRDADSEKIFDVTILRGRLTYQLNRYLFFRGILEHNDLRQNLSTEFLASFTYIPGTVFHIGYGSLYNKFVDGLERDHFIETDRGFFSKISYLWRL